MAYYDRIAKQWHGVTGYSGGSLKRHILNDRIIACIGSVDDVSILEVGAGNGYFMPLAMKRFSGQIPRRLVISDASQRLLDIAQTSFAIPDAEYMCLDIRKPFHWHGFNAREQGIYPSQQVLRDKPGLAKAGNIPIAAIFVADKMTMNGEKHDND